MIPFVRLFPDGKQKRSDISRPKPVEAQAERFILAGGRYCIGTLIDGRVRMTAVMNANGATHEIADEVSTNGPELMDAVDRLVAASVSKVRFAPDIATLSMPGKKLQQ